MDYIDKHYDEIECELNGDVYGEPKKCKHNLFIYCNMENTIDYQKSTLVCMKCGLCEYYPVYVTYNHKIATIEKKMHIQKI